jgi:hypothetical protein
MKKNIKINIKRKNFSNKMEYLKLNGIHKQRKIYLYTTFDKKQAEEYRKLRGRYYKKKNYWVFPSNVFENKVPLLDTSDKTVLSNEENSPLSGKDLVREKYLPEEPKDEILREESKEEYFKEESKEEYFKEESKEEYFKEESKDDEILREESKEEYLREESKEEYLREESKEEILREESKEEILREESFLKNSRDKEYNLKKNESRKYTYQPQPYFYEFVKSYQTLLNCF